MADNDHPDHPHSSHNTIPGGMMLDDGHHMTFDQLLHLSVAIGENQSVQMCRPLMVLTLGTLRRVPNLHVSFQEFITMNSGRPDDALVLLDSRGPRIEEIN